MKVRTISDTQLQILVSILAYVGWFGCVYFEKWGLGVATIVFPLCSWLVLWFSLKKKLEVVLPILTMAAIGLLFDSALHKLKFINFENSDFIILPLWLVSLWLCFVTTLPALYRVLKGRALLGVILGAIFGPLSYYAGESLQVLYFLHEYILFYYAIFWGLFFWSLDFVFLFFKKGSD